MFKGLKQKYENVVNRWLYSEEIAEHERQVESGVVPRPQQNGPTEAEMQAEYDRQKAIHEKQLELIKAEDHKQPPSKEDIERYYKYHCNMVENINLIKKETGQEPPWPVPKNPLTEKDYNVMVAKDGWKGMRMSCGLPTGDLSKPKKPWTMADTEKKWSVDEPEIHWKTKD